MRLGRLMKTLVVMVAVLAVLSGCRSMTGKSAGTNIDDASITTAVKSKLVNEAPLQPSGASVPSAKVRRQPAGSS